MGFSEEIEDVKITMEKNEDLKIKAKIWNWPKFVLSNWTLRYKTVKTRKHYKKYLYFRILAFDYISRIKMNEDLFKKNEDLPKNCEENEGRGYP